MWVLRNNKHGNTHLQNAFNKYGMDCFSFNILNWATDQDELNRQEIYFIDEYNCLKQEYGYNLREGGSNGKPSKETKRKMSISAKGRIFSNETRLKLSKSKKGKNNPFYGKKHSEEAKRKMSESHKGNDYGRTGKKHSLEHRKNISKSHQGEYPGATYDKSKNPEGNCWRSSIGYKINQKHLMSAPDPISCTIVYLFVWEEIYGK